MDYGNAKTPSMYCMLGSVTLLQPAFCSVVVKCKKRRKKVKKDVGLKSRGMGGGNLCLMQHCHHQNGCYTGVDNEVSVLL